ncbi:hypothetical protein ACFSM5_07945 [Lacibacterium aquatile]|uniref:Uncharacterized protein n=1 Tax=Lacibacterium aquatile TaxID=1168082 RepID=A0ABW5DS99_9PROT
MPGSPDFSILAPVPLEHLKTGREIAITTGFVAFGSRKWDLFRKVDELRGAAPVPVLIYPSHEGVSAKSNFLVSWLGWYVGCEESGSGKHSKGLTHRPPTTGQNVSDNQGHWAVFWHVSDLYELPVGQRLPISAIQTVKGGWRKSAAPRGPELVSTPSALELPI